jgi:nucleoid-associated protein YgaU
MATTAGKLEKATLTIREPNPPGSSQPLGSEIGTLVFDFNPKEYSITKRANWSAPSGPGHEKAQPKQFNGGEPRTLSLEVFLDATDTESGSVTKDVELLLRCCEPTAQSMRSHRPSAPYVQFRWGTTIEVVAFVRSASAKLTLFRPDGSPVRAACTLDLEELPSPVARQNPTSGALEATRTHTVVDGDSLALIAYREYGDASGWREIAAANDIDDPMRLRRGARLLLPPRRPAGVSVT